MKKDFDMLDDHLDEYDLLFFALSMEWEVSEGFPRMFMTFRSRRLIRLILLTRCMKIAKSDLSERWIFFKEMIIDDFKRKILNLIVIEDELEFHW